jgi:hypothetical protein
MARRPNDVWYHVTPLFLFASIVRHGGLRCGTDVAQDGLPRRASSKDDDDQPTEALNGARPADCILLFTSSLPPLLRSKIESRKGAWKAFPHVVIHFAAPACMNAANRRIYGSIGNVGRTIRAGETLQIAPYTRYTDVYSDSVQEVMIHADNLSNRLLPLNTATCVECFSPADREIVAKYLGASSITLTALLSEKRKYVDAQSQPPADNFLKLTREFYEAIRSKDECRQQSLMEQLANLCFD